MSDKKPISASELLMIANQLIQDHDAYIEGMRATSVEEKDGVLVFKGEYFLDEKGLPTEKTTAVFNIFKFLAHKLSPEFTVQSEFSA
ncbi:YciN family protein [uncultured Photobacterium sp.]|uniref:YciN family protein n=1 Tax=uncultured Photobacterium sp. TaxID=173973 RepID=UPI0026182DEB|nr:YciN family protein [uncultured Photobacterium sp.]